MKGEPHYTVQQARPLLGMWSRKTILRRLEEAGYQIPRGIRGRKILIPAHIVHYIQQKYAVRLKTASQRRYERAAERQSSTSAEPPNQTQYNAAPQVLKGE